MENKHKHQWITDTGEDGQWIKRCKECKEVKKTIINQNSKEESSLSQQEQEKEKKEKNREQYFGKKSLVKYLWCCRTKNLELPNIIKVAKLGDEFIKEAKYKLLTDVATDLGYQLKKRNEITDYQRRRIPSYRIGRNSYYLTNNNDKLK